MSGSRADGGGPPDRPRPDGRAAGPSYPGQVVTGRVAAQEPTTGRVATQEPATEEVATRGAAVGTVLAACVVRALRDDPGPVGVTAIDKRPVDGPVRVGALGLRGDVQADRKHHGGETRAVYAYGQDDAEHWERELGRTLPAGWFGENLRVAGFDPSTSRVGERWRVGERVVLEVTGPRVPCSTFGRWVGGDDERGWVRRFRDAGRVGAYLRVVERGSVAAGDVVVVEPAEDPSAPTVREVLLG